MKKGLYRIYVFLDGGIPTISSLHSSEEEARDKLLEIFRKEWASGVWNIKKHVLYDVLNQLIINQGSS